ncbi:MAG: HAMP domain-containing protein [Burkholderiales bacterium]|nr:HAMP domain-containing protein [Burkholderiales bacterium]
MKHRFDTLFGRLALLIIAVLVISHFSWLTILRNDRRERLFEYSADQMAFIFRSAQAVMDGHSHIPLPDSVHFEKALFDGPNAFTPAGQSEHLTQQLAQRLPAGTDLRIEQSTPPRMWAKLPGAKQWISTPIVMVHTPPSALKAILPGVLTVLLITVIFSLLTAWLLQRPVRDMAAAAEKLAIGEDVKPLKERGPRELRQLTERFNRMITDIAQAERERNTMLAGIAHDLKTPLSRLRLRAEIIDDPAVTRGIVRDVESMARIVDQFLLFARGVESLGPPAPVDSRLPYVLQVFADQGHSINTALHAGPHFQLKATHLERIVNNLLDNAVSYGQAPLSVCTARTANGWELAVEDSGPGIPEEDLARIVRPFVRLDPARSGNAHCGLGLAIVDKLAQQLGGKLVLNNRPSGGLRAAVIFPLRDNAA